MSKQCKKCGSERIMYMGGKTSDMFNMNGVADVDYSGYVPSGLNVGSSDYFEIELCMDCGTVQGEWPVTDEKLQEAVNDR